MEYGRCSESIKVRRVLISKVYIDIEILFIVLGIISIFVLGFIVGYKYGYEYGFNRNPFNNKNKE